MYYSGDKHGNKKALRKMSYTITIFNHPDMGIDIAGLPPEQRKKNS